MSNRFNHESKPEFFEKYGKLSFAAVSQNHLSILASSSCGMTELASLLWHQEWRNIVEQGADGKPRTFVKDVRIF